jgi:hypothetical protein
MAYIRLVKGAFTEYRQARALVNSFWKDHRSLGLGSFILSVTYFEARLTNIHRATEFMICLRRRPEARADMNKLFPKKAQFTKPRVARRIRDMRNGTQHLDDVAL